MNTCTFIGHEVKPDFQSGFGNYYCPRCGERWNGYVEFCEATTKSDNKRISSALILIVWVLSFVLVSKSCDAAVTPRFLDSVERIESGFNPLAIGDKGKALGLFQFHAESWADCSEIRRAKNLPVYQYRSATNPYISRLYAGTWFAYLESRLVASGQKPTRELLLACHQVGIQGAKRRNFNLRKLPTSTRQAVAKLNQNQKI